MKKIIQVGVLLIILMSVLYYRAPIVSWLVKNFFFSEGVVIDNPNEYVLNYKYVNVQTTTDFYAKTKQHLYNIIFTGLNNGNSSFYFFCDYDDCQKDVTAMSENNLFLNINNFVHPYNSYKKLYVSMTTYDKITISIVKTYSNDEISLINQEIDKIENKIITPNMTTKEKIKAFHDYIVNSTVYDKSYVDNTENTIGSPSNNALGPLFYGKALCGGYTDVMGIFLNRLGVPNYRLSSEFHIWNLAYINNGWYHIDLTWDDPVTSNGANISLDKFFLISTKTLESYNTEYHIFDKSIAVEATYN